MRYALIILVAVTATVLAGTTLRPANDDGLRSIAGFCLMVLTTVVVICAKMDDDDRKKTT